MPRSQNNKHNEDPDRKSIPRAEITQPPAPDVLEGDAGPTAVSEGDRIAGLVKEYSGWDVYNNEARKVDTELVKDWTASLNSLLLFVSHLVMLSDASEHSIGCHFCRCPDRVYYREQKVASTRSNSYYGGHDGILYE
jgi:hypothetical protein